MGISDIALTPEERGDRWREIIGPTAPKPIMKIPPSPQQPRTTEARAEQTIESRRIDRAVELIAELDALLAEMGRCRGE